MQTKNNKLYIGNYFVGDLLKEFGSPVFVYEEEVLRARCKELVNLVKRVKLNVHYSCKANNSIALLCIIKEEGLCVDAMSLGEILLEQEAGFEPEQIVYVSNNVTKDELKYVVDKGIRVSVDSLSQLEYYGQVNPGGKVFVRINPGIGAGHHEKVITAGKAKFGIMPEKIDQIKAIASKHNLTIHGINMHIGSLFLKPDKYLEAMGFLLDIAERFEDLEYIDFGGGIGIPYEKDKEPRFPIKEFGEKLDELLYTWQEKTGRSNITFIIEPGRYVVAESCTILSNVNSIKENYGMKYVGTDIGFNLLARPVMYDSYHHIIVGDNVKGEEEQVTVCGNICESGDLLAKDRMLPNVTLDSPIAVLDAGAYGYVMSSNYNARLKPAEVLITQDGKAKLIRKKEELESVLKNQIY